MNIRLHQTLKSNREDLGKSTLFILIIFPSISIKDAIASWKKLILILNFPELMGIFSAQDFTHTNNQRNQYLIGGSKL